MKYYSKEPVIGKDKALGTISIGAHTRVVRDPEDPRSFSLFTPSRTFYLQGNTSNDAGTWCAAIQEACNRAELEGSDTEEHAQHTDSRRSSGVPDHLSFVKTASWE